MAVPAQKGCRKLTGTWPKGTFCNSYCTSFTVVTEWVGTVARMREEGQLCFVLNLYVVVNYFRLKKANFDTVYVYFINKYV